MVVDLSVTWGKTAVPSFPNPLVPLRRHATVSTSMCQECVPQVHINGAKNIPGLNLPIPKQDLRQRLLPSLHAKSASKEQRFAHILL